MARLTSGGLFISRPAALQWQPGQVQGITLMSDIHLGAANIDLPRVKRELAEARENGDRVLINGDVFDLILPSDHKRFMVDALHPRLRGKRDIINKVVDWGLEIFGPYADLIDMVGLGNHETAVEKHHSIDVVGMLVYRLQELAPKDHLVHYGGYTGFVDYRFRNSRDGRRLVIYYHHGSGGTSPITKGMIDFSRKNMFIDADVVWLGHKHHKIADTTPLRLRCPKNGNDPVTDQQVNVMTGSYMVSYAGQSQASVKKHGRRAPYSSDWGLPPQAPGGARLMVSFPTDGGKELKILQ